MPPSPPFAHPELGHCCCKKNRLCLELVKPVSSHKGTTPTGIRTRSVSGLSYTPSGWPKFSEAICNKISCSMHKGMLSTLLHLTRVKNAVSVRWALVGFVVILALVARSDASTARTLSLAEISKSAEIIADVTVQNVESYWE